MKSAMADAGFMEAYDISQLFEFIDQLADLSCLVFDKASGKYVPRNKAWIKEKIYML